MAISEPDRRCMENSDFHSWPVLNKNKYISENVYTLKRSPPPELSNLRTWIMSSLEPKLNLANIWYLELKLLITPDHTKVCPHKFSSFSSSEEALNWGCTSVNEDHLNSNMSILVPSYPTFFDDFHVYETSFPNPGFWGALNQCLSTIGTGTTKGICCCVWYSQDLCTTAAWH